MPRPKIKTSALLWLLLIGGVLEALYAYDLGIDMIQQAENSLQKIQAEHFAFNAAVQGLPWLIPVQVGILLAWLSAIASAIEYLKIKKENETEAEKRKTLIASRFQSVIIASPALVVLGLLVAIYTAYSKSTQATFLGTARLTDFGFSILLALLFGVALAALGAIQIRALFKWPQASGVIVASVLTIPLGMLSVFVIDYCISSLVW